MPEAKPAGRGRKLAKAVAVQAPEAKPSPSRLAHQRTHRKRPTRTGQDEGATALHGAPPAVQTVTPALASAREPTRCTITGAGRTTTGLFDLARLRANGLIEAPGLDSPTHQGRHASACPSRPGSPPHPIGAMPSASSSPPSTATPTRRRRPAPGRLTARRGALTRAQWRRRERSEATEQTRGSAGCEHPAEPHHLAPTGPAGRRSKIIRMCLCARGGERVDHRRRASLRRLMMSAFGPPPAPLRFVKWTTRSGQGRGRSQKAGQWRP